jgi:N-acetylneuraminic acid mutarotase
MNHQWNKKGSASSPTIGLRSKRRNIASAAILGTWLTIPTAITAPASIVWSAPPADEKQRPEALVATSLVEDSSNAVQDTLLAKLHRPLPEPLTSFAATVMGDYLYVFSGHSGGTHGFGKQLLVDQFRRIRFDDPSAEWEELAMHDSAQSAALVHDGKYIYRIAGLSFIDKEDGKADFKSTDYFTRYDLESNTWTEMAPLPVPRSSLDAAILGREIYVAGGWNLQGPSASTAPWHEDMLKFDLDRPELGWQMLPGVGYKTRAISMAAHNGKIYVIGGIQDRGITRKVSVFDPAKQSWSEGPELPADNRSAGFATSSFATGGNLYVTGSSGVVYRLSEAGDAWEVETRLLFPRNFLRLLPIAEDRLIALGGTGPGGRTAVVESLRVGQSSSSSALQPKQVQWVVPYDGSAKHSQTLVLDGTKLYAFGGNKSWAPHDFSPEAFSSEVYRYDLSDGSVTRMADMPRAGQSAAGVAMSRNSEHRVIALAGGLGVNGESKFGSLDDVQFFDPESNSWESAAVSLPESRGMATAVAQNDAMWIFAGSRSGAKSGLSPSTLHWWGDDSNPAVIPNADIPHPRRSAATAVIGNDVYLIGGIGEGMNLVSAVDVFNTETRQWRTVNSPNKARVFPTAAVSGGKIFLFGGFTPSSDHLSATACLEVYDPTTDKWTVWSENLKDVDASMRMLSHSDRLLFFGIDRNKDSVARFVLLDPTPTAVPETVETMSFAGGGRSSDEVERNAKIIMRKDSDKDWKLSREEVGGRLTEFFDKADANRDGALEYSEVLDAMKAEQQ